MVEEPAWNRPPGDDAVEGQLPAYPDRALKHGPTHRRQWGLPAVIAAVVVLAGVVAVGIATHHDRSGPTFTASGIVNVPGYRLYPGRLLCIGLGDYWDLQDRATVNILDQNGKLLTEAELTGGILTGADQRNCQFKFVLSKVSAGRPAYQLWIGRRGPTRYTEAVLRNPLTINFGGS